MDSLTSTTFANNCFRQVLVDRYEKTLPDVPTIQYQTLDDALKSVQYGANCTFDSQSHIKQSNKCRAEHEDIDSMIMDIHENLIGYWNQFGFMNKSNKTSFLQLIKNNIISFKPSAELGDEEIENSDDDE